MRCLPRLGFLIMLAAMSFPVFSQEKDQVTLRVRPNPNDALAIAAADCSEQPASSQPFLRYIWVDSGDPEEAQAVSFALNVVSRGTTIVRPVPLGKDRLIVLRCDLRSYAPRAKDLKEWLSIWEDFQFDPRFNLLITKGTLKFAVLAFADFKAKAFVTRSKDIQVPSEPYVEAGVTYHKRWDKVTVTELEEITVTKLKDVELARIPGPHLDPTALAQLVSLTRSQAPIVTDGYFLGRALSTIKDKGVYATIYGGRYYELSDIRTGAKKGTDEDVLLEQLGVGSVEHGITAKKLFEDLRSDQRAFKLRSDVTGHPRSIEFYRTLAGRLDLTSSLISFTRDLKDQSIDIDTHPVANLLEFKHDATEVIFEKRNGLHGYALFNGQGKRQDEVPPDVAVDHTITQNRPKRLQSAISCIACHEAEGSDGWKKFGNDVLTLLNGRKRLDVFGDVGRPDASISDTLDRLAGLYKGDPERTLQRARDDYSLAMLKTTGPWKASKGQTDVVKLAGTKLTNRWRRYFFEDVSPKEAMAELGVEFADPKTSKEEYTKAFNAMVLPEVKAGVPVPEIGQVVVPEDPRIAALKAGIPISRFDWDLSYAFAAGRWKDRPVVKEKK